MIHPKHIPVVTEQAPAPVEHTQQNPTTLLQKLFWIDGRIGRLSFVLLSVGQYFFVILGLVAGDAVSRSVGSEMAFVPAIVVVCTFLWSHVAVTAKRLHDRDRSGWWQLLAVVPILGFVQMLFLAFASETPGPNRFGDAL